MPANKEEAQYARELHERIRREFPEVRAQSQYGIPNALPPAFYHQTRI